MQPERKEQEAEKEKAKRKERIKEGRNKGGGEKDTLASKNLDLIGGQQDKCTNSDILGEKVRGAGKVESA